MSGPGNPCRTITSPCTFPSIGSPAYFASAGFGSNVSTWLQPPPLHKEINARARGAQGGRRVHPARRGGAGRAGRRPGLLRRQQPLPVEQVGEGEPADAAARAEEKF